MHLHSTRSSAIDSPTPEMVPCFCCLASLREISSRSSNDYITPRIATISFPRVVESLGCLVQNLPNLEAAPRLSPSIECSADVQRIPCLQKTVASVHIFCTKPKEMWLLQEIGHQASRSTSFGQQTHMTSSNEDKTKVQL